MRIALIGTRGAPARYGGFETAVEEVGARLAAAGHSVTVYCRNPGQELSEHRGMRLVNLPALHLKAAETLSHTALSALHHLFRPCDVAIVFNAANAPLLPLIRARGVPTAVHVDGLEWKRGKWGKLGRRYYLQAERLAIKFADALIADAHGIADYYAERYGAEATYLAYGAPIVEHRDPETIASLGLESGCFHLVVARFEPENHVSMILEGYRSAAPELPMVAVGSAPYAGEESQRIEALAADVPGIRLLGGVWDQELLDQLYANARAYFHGHSVGGTNPSLLRAMGAGAPVAAYDVVFNREVLGDTGMFFHDPGSVARLIEEAERDPRSASERGLHAQERARRNYDWDDVARGYEELCFELADSRRGLRSRPRANTKRESGLS